MKGETLIAFTAVLGIILFLLMAGSYSGSDLNDVGRIELGRNYLVITIVLVTLIAVVAYTVY